MGLPQKIRVIVLGGGISGLTAARTLQEQERDFLLLERCPTLGGMTRTVEVGDFCFDYTGHFLHLSRYATPGDIPYANLNNDEWARISRRSCCFVGGKLITAPIQYNLAELPKYLFHQCVESYNAKPSLLNSADATFRDYMVSGFGQVLADLFLIPQNEKTMAISLDLLSKDAVRRFFPAPDEKLVRNGMAARAPLSANSYNSTFWYPKTGGIGRLVQGLRTGIRNCAVNQDITSVNLREKTICTSTSGMIRWDQMFSSIPLNSLCELTGDEELQSRRRRCRTVRQSASILACGVHCALNLKIFIGSIFRTGRSLFIESASIPILGRGPARRATAPFTSKLDCRQKKSIAPIFSMICSRRSSNP